MSTHHPRDRPALWIPGPTEVAPEILEVLAEPMIGHRTPEMESVIASLDPHLHVLFGASAGAHRVAVHSCTATALMELGLRAVGPRILSLVNGSFSARFAEIAEVLGKHVVRIESPLGASADLDAAREALAIDAYDAITVCASETSTGALTSPARLAAALGDRGDALLLVDVVTYAGAAPIEVTEHGIDFAFAGTQKALALPPGLGLFAVSERMDARARSTASSSYFLDLARIVDAHASRKPPMTPTISLYRALGAQFERIAAHGFEHRWAEHDAMRARTREIAEGRGLSVFGPSESARETSPTVTCVEVSDPRTVLVSLEEHGYRIGGGYGPLKDRCVRIGHMGDHTLPQLEGLLAAFARISG